MNIAVAALAFFTGCLTADAWTGAQRRGFQRMRTVQHYIIKQDASRPPIDRTGGRSLYLDPEDDKRKICYDAVYGDESKLNVLVLPYLYTPKNQGIASQIEAFCRKNDFSYVCADYAGVSKSGGRTEEGTISRWTSDTIKLLETVVTGKTVLVGAAVGAWVMIRVAMERPDLVAGLVGISCDPDFTEELLWANLSEEDKNAIMEKGKHEVQWGNNRYEVTKNLILDGRENLVLQDGPNSLPIKAPVRMIHGTADEEVPLSTAMRIMDAVQSNDVHVTILKGMTHFIEGYSEFQALIKTLDDVLEAAELNVFDLRTPASG